MNRFRAEDAASIVFVGLFGSHVTVIYCEQNSLYYMHGTMYTISNAKKTIGHQPG